ncbi:BnaC08g15970D [Brassica napus]|uniref:BnaC08g15970D protein n=1 Tax=Brassica napus TaxID=3708 RepID=A0A078IJS7_BRANA|nr:BnaC08g15970D [Brassica napus]
MSCMELSTALQLQERSPTICMKGRERTK